MYSIKTGLMNTALLFSFLPLLLSTSFGQSFRIESNSDTIRNEFTVDGYQNVNVNIYNISSDKITLGWEVLDRRENENWDYSLCDLGNCYIGVPNAGKMAEMDTFDRAFLRVTANPRGNVDYCIFTFRVFDINEKEYADTITFIAAVTGSSIHEKAIPSWQFWPNPVINELVVSTHESIKSISVFGITGKEEFTFNNADIANQSTLPIRLDMTSMKPGAYIIKLETEKGESQRIFIKD